jgi:hypothetical protein
MADGSPKRQRGAVEAQRKVDALALGRAGKGKCRRWLPPQDRATKPSARRTKANQHGREEDNLRHKS